MNNPFKVEVTEENVQTLLPAANLLQLNDVRDACCEFLLVRIGDCNFCVDIINLECLISASNVGTLKFKDQCLIPQ